MKSSETPQFEVATTKREVSATSPLIMMMAVDLLCCCGLSIAFTLLNVYCLLVAGLVVCEAARPALTDVTRCH
ncbi:hypothetical protein GNE10_10695 [Nostoc sp. 2RC]|nr:hypothetical protein [Nostoc sp. 2RC]